MTFSRPRALFNTALFSGLIVGLLGPYMVLSVLWPAQRHRVAALFFKGCLRLTGLRLAVTGWPAPRTALFAVNHVSYLDIPVLGALLSQGVFVAKSEVADWPLFGFLARLSLTEFITRKGSEVRHQCKGLANRINGGTSLIVFPEGTSTDGSSVRAFKSPLFASLDRVHHDTGVQPITIAYENPECAWHGDMTLVPHLWHMFGTRGGRVDVIFHAPVARAEFPDRKHMAKHCENVVRRGLEGRTFKSYAPHPIAAE